MKRTLRTLTALSLAGMVVVSCSPLNKMKKNAGDLNYNVTPDVLHEKGEMVDVKIDLTIPPKYFNKNVTLVATPVLKYEGGQKAFEPETLQGENVTGNNTVVPFEAGKTITYTGKIPYADAMRISDLVVEISAAKGAKSVNFNPVKVAEGVIATATLVSNAPAIALGQDEFQRITPEINEAAIYYLVNSSQVRNNQITSAEIKDMEKFIKTTSTEEDLNLKNIEIRSYASPEGAYDWNEKLAGKREGSADNFLKNNMRRNKIEDYKKAEEIFKKYTVAEDWEGFKKEMEESNIPDKELILRVLAMHSDPEVREREIRNMASTFSIIADQVLPKLRRSKFVVNAERIGKSDEEIKTLAKSNPSELNVEELLYSATLFDSNSDKLSIYQRAMSQFPNDWRGFNDAGLIQFEQGDVAQAKANFDKANSLSPNNVVVNNNLGAVALKNGNVKDAEVLFGAATGAGDEVNYNKGIVAIKKGDYSAAASYFGNCNCVNAALANILAGNNSVALKKLNDGNDTSALASYLKAVIGARTNDSNMVYTNLKDACSKDSSMRRLAATDMEFAKYFENSEFKSIVQ